MWHLHVAIASDTPGGVMTFRPLVLISTLSLFVPASPLFAQVATGTIAGVIEDAGGAVLPGVSVALSGERLIGGTATADHRQQRRVPVRSPAAGHIRAQVRAPGLPDRRAARHRRQRELHRHGQPEARGRRAAGNDHRSRRIADRRHQVEPAADGDEPGDPRRRADRTRSVVAREDHPRRPGEHLRRRRHAGDAAEHAARAWIARRRQELRDRRHDGELARRRRRLDDALLRPGHVRGGQLPDVGDPGGGHDRRHLPEHGHEERQQPLARRYEDVLLAAELAERQLRRRDRRRTAGRHPDHQALRLQRRRRRTARAQQAVDQRRATATGASTS